MQHDVSPTRKMFSHSNKVIWTSANIVPQSNSEGIRGKIDLSLKQKFKGSVARLHQEQKYERFIDHLLLQHAQEANIPVLTKSLSKKHSYRSCRIVKTEQIDPNPEAILTRKRKDDTKTERMSTERKRSDSNDQVEGKQKKTLQLPLIFKFKKNDQLSGEGKQQTEQSQTEPSRQAKLKELKQNMIFKYIRTPRD